MVLRKLVKTKRKLQSNKNTQSLLKLAVLFQMELRKLLRKPFMIQT